MPRRTLVLALVAAAAALTGCTSGGEEAGPTETAPPATAPQPTETAPATETAPETETTEPAPPPAELALPVSLLQFGAYDPVPALDPDAPAYPGPATPTSLEAVEIAPELERDLGRPGAIEALLERGFVIVPADYNLFHFAYQSNIYEGWPVYVTTDAAYHAWHLVFDKLLRDLEQQVLLPRLERLVSGLLEAARAQAADLAGAGAGDAAGRVEQLFALAAAELGLRVELGPLAEAERALVEAHGTTETSPLVGKEIDYSLFTPRGHYTRTPELTRFFLAMSVLGQLDFCLPGTVSCPGLEPARMAILASRLVAGDPALAALWREIYEPTAFLVGLADDYSPLEVSAAAAAAAPDALADPAALADDATVEAVLTALVATRPVLISPDRASVRVMGTRFVVDSYILDQLLYPYVGTDAKPRLLPSALDVAAAFSSDFALAALAEAGQTDYERYDAQLEALRVAVTARPAADWGSTVYDAWLHALAPSFAAHGAAYPDYMRGEAWAAKALQSGLGSYAELKHDTILYAKQAVAEGGADLEETQRNWVEPEPVVFARLAAVADLTRGGLESRGLLGEEQATLLADVSELFRFLERIARDELAGGAISPEDNERLAWIGGALESVFWSTSDRLASGDITADEDAAIVADLASGPEGILELGTGRIDRIYVLVPDDQGTFHVAAGGVYSFYEFSSPPGERLDDESWRALLDAGQAPARPPWTAAFSPG
ncbi:MAG: DUF3160 domain-containing protein [Thermoleophilia bacterium]|nr:DUF3160 domain-containing protein [Thermoleophilia bacterium]